MGKKTFNRVVSLVISFMMILSGTQVFFADIGPPYDEDDISLNKTATPVDGEENAYKIELSVKGKDIVTKKMVDVVLVIDNSNSMHNTYDDDGKSLAQITEDAANTFIDGVLTSQNNGNVRVAVVQYGTHARAYQFTSNNWTYNWRDNLTVDGDNQYTEDKELAKNAVDEATKKYSNSNDGGTNTEGGFLMASKLVNARRDGAESIVIFMTDGMPTYRYDGNSAESDSHWFWGGGGSQTSKAELNEAIEAAQSLSSSSEIYTVALLSAFEENSNEDRLARNLLSTSPKKYTSNSDTRNIMPHVNKDERWTSVQAYTAKYYPIFSHVNADAKMQEIYGTLSGVVNALAKGTVTDIIPESFMLTEESKGKLESEYNAIITSVGNKTKIEFPNVLANQVGTTLEYDVKAKTGVYGTGFTNEEAYYTFTLFGNVVPSEPKYFPKPIVVISPTAVNDDGYEVLQGETLNASKSILENDETVKLAEGNYEVDDLVVEDTFVGTITTEKGGTVTLNTDGTFVYEPPNPEFHGEDTFEYRNKATVKAKGEDDDKLAKDYSSNYAIVTIIVKAIGDNSAKYITQHYLQTADFESYDLKETVTKTEKIGELVNGQPKTYLGYNYNSEVEGTISQGTVVADDSLVLKLFYDAIPYNVEYESNGGNGTMTDPKNPYIFGEEVEVLSNGFTHEGYEFVGWGYRVDGPVNLASIGDEYDSVYEPADTFIMPAANVVLYALWQETETEEPDPEYEDNVIIVNHYIKQGNDEEVLHHTDEPRPVTTSSTIRGEDFKDNSIVDDGYKFEGSQPESIDVYANTTAESAIKFIFNLLYTKDESGGEDPGGEDPGGEDPGGEDPGGEDPGGEDPGGEDPGGEDPGGNDPGGGDPSGGSPGGGSPGTLIPDNEIPLAELDRVDHFAYVIGYPEGDVRPLNNITREEVAMIFYRLLTDDSRDALLSDENPLDDVDGDRWSNRAISTLYKADIISGYPDGTFRPTDQITRAEFATIAAKFDDLDLQNESKFTDIVGHWAEDYITSSENKGWINGYPDMTFKPERDITRAEAMTLINNVLGRAVPAENIHQNAMFWPDNPSTEWYYEAVMEATNSHDYLYEEDGDELWTGMKMNKIWP